MMMAPMSLERFDSGSVSPPERFDAWREAVSSAFVPLDVEAEHPEQHRGTLAGQSLGVMEVIEVTGDPVHVLRNRRTIARGDPGVYKLGLQLRGYCVLAQDGREAALTPGDLAIYDTTRPYDLYFDSSYRMLVIQIPRSRLALPPRQIERVTADRISGRQGLGALASALLGKMGEQLREGGIEPDAKASEAVLDLIVAAVSSRLHGGDQQLPAREVIWLQCLDYIDEHLADPSLSVASVAHAVHVSDRYLQRLFAEQGTTASEWIRNRRLEGCRTELLDPSASQHSVSSIALRWGYSDASSFTRSFKQTFGYTPTEFRYSFMPAATP